MISNESVLKEKILGTHESIKDTTCTITEGDVEINLPINRNNVVTGDKLRMVMSRTLNETKDFLAKTFGPMGSNTKIIKGNTQQDINSSYSKDGLKVLSNIINSGPIEASIVDEILEVTRAVEKQVGDGTTSTVILSAILYDKMKNLEAKHNIPPFTLCRLFNDAVEEIKKDIMSKAKPCTIDDIYKISMISTNGNTEVSHNIKNIYEKYGMDVDLSVGISNDSNSLVRVYDGLTISEGMSDPVYINNRAENTAEIHDAHIYYFPDPIDTMDMMQYFDAIIAHNIYEPMANDEEPIPTVITCPKLTRDLSASLKQLANTLYQYDNKGVSAAKPPILIITNVVAGDEAIMNDIANLCGCKDIRKYIDRKAYEKDVESGVAPTVETVHEFYGKADLVVADSKKTKFINPMHLNVEAGEEDPVYTAMINFLETEIENIKSSGNASEIGSLKRRLAALKANMVDYLVGGVTIAERDMKKDLVEDAIKNCKSASLYGIGNAANYEGLRAAYNYYESIDVDLNPEGDDSESYKARKLQKDIAEIILDAYLEISRILYHTVCYDDEVVANHIIASLKNGAPFDISSGTLPEDLTQGSDSVLCSIKLDINILDTVSKIISIMVTCNQCLLQGSNLNVY